MTEKKARQILGEVGKNLSSEELEKIITSLSALADIFLEQSKTVIDKNTKKHLRWIHHD